MPDIPHGVLSEHLEGVMGGRRLLGAVFLSFRFDPEFFETEVLPSFVSVSLSHVPEIRLLQLDEALRAVPYGVAVYYDQNGLAVGSGSSRLDIRRIPVRHRTGVFHPKNVLALLESSEPDEEGRRERSLLVVTLSANLTRAGWWENVEVCHTEEIGEGASTRLRDDLIALLDGLERRVGDRAAEKQLTLREIRRFLRATEQRMQRSADGRLHPHVYVGGNSVVEFLGDVAGSRLRGMNLEVISPYLDQRPPSRPLEELLAAFSPSATRVCVPRSRDGSLACTEEMFDWLAAQPGVEWGSLPKERLRSGNEAGAAPRFVHAKVYRFFRAQPKEEILFLGSVNLTDAAHRAGGNFETGVLVEIDPPRRPEWWLSADVERPREFIHRDEAEGTTAMGGSRLSIRYAWDRDLGEVYWDDATAAPRLKVEASGRELFQLSGTSPRTWVALEAAATEELTTVLRSTSLLEVLEEGAQAGLVLVQETGMSHRPSLLLDLPVSEILRYWSQLTSDQRAAFLEVHGGRLSETVDGSALVAALGPHAVDGSVFEKFAGIFLAFGTTERSIRTTLEAGAPVGPVIYRLFGQKYDSLGNLLERVVREAGEAAQGVPVEQYVTALCAKQMVTGLTRDYPGFLPSRLTT
ncbi:MAG: hypothetical protein IPK72_16290 [Candidatus Eisenbacteria bacterium]|nr:hypothetical protein [Candidatus Eisenbacteria bacterium]